jgi:hypothetical protein
MKSLLVMAAITCLIFAATPAFATSISVTGGTADFNFSGSTGLTVVLTATTSPTTGIAQSLTGLLFQLSSPLNGFTLNSVIPAGIVNCNGDNSYPCPSVTGSTLNGWALTSLVGNSYEITPSPLGWHPDGIINTNYTPPGGNGGLSNAQHNPWLVGPVDFNFTFNSTTPSPNVTSATFYFGTSGANLTGTPIPPTGGGPVPEPSSLVLLGTGLTAIGIWFRKRQKGN